MRKSSLLLTGPVAGFIALVWLLFFPPIAAASGLVRPLAGEIILGFNDGYQLGGQTRYHTGVDIAGDPGARVNAAGAGQVSFCGRVPGPAGSGERVLAVTIALADGRLATYMPLFQARVAKGQSVGQGENIGTLAASGDGSSARAHLHMGLRENGNYVDPSSLPLATPPSTSTRPAPQPEDVPAPNRSPLPIPQTSPPVVSGRSTASGVRSSAEPAPNVALRWTAPGAHATSTERSGAPLAGTRRARVWSRTPIE